jgi:glycosyltransferase involved in cell wall biosynthesis
MNILINCSNLNRGGALQVAHSFLNYIKNNTEYHFIVVFTDELKSQINLSEFNNRFKFFTYSISLGANFLKGNVFFLDRLVIDHNISIVFSIFGPTYWRPKIKHVVGYAKPQYIYTDSPFFSILSTKAKSILKLKKFIHLRDFNINADVLITENEDVTIKLKNIFPSKPIFTVTNFYNQVFDSPHMWDRSVNLGHFDGFTFLTVAANYPHKNINIISDVVNVLSKFHPEFKFRFILTIDESEFLAKNSFSKNNIVFLGKVKINQLPYLYSQVNFVFLPTLLECFSAAFPEAMKMCKPILTSDLDFSKGLCGNAAVYFDPLNPVDIVKKILFLANDESLKKYLIDMGLQRLSSFDNYSIRASKYFTILLNEANHSRP